jgi:hypothetical protein
VVQTRDPPTFSGLLDEKRIPDLSVWYRRIEVHSQATHQHIRDILDRCTEGVANQIVQQFYLQDISDPVSIKAMFLNHFSHLIHRDSTMAFNDLIFGSGLKMKIDETVETYISHFRLLLFKADIPENELKPNTAIVRTLIQVFVKGLPEPIAKDLRVDKNGEDFSTMQELYTAALLSGKKFLKRKAASLPPAKSSEKDKKQKTSANSASEKQKTPVHDKKKPHFPSSQGKSKKESTPPSKTSSTGKTLLQRALNSLPQVKDNTAHFKPLYDKTPEWPEPFPEFNKPPLQSTDNAFYVAKSVVGSDRMKAAKAAKACVFCALPVPTDRPTNEHLIECKHRPY